MKILVAGSAGFLGREVVKLLSVMHEVITVDIDGNPDYLFDLSDSSNLDSLPDVDVVINCAAVQYVTKNKPFFNRKAWFYRNNVDVVRNLIDRYECKGAYLIHVATSMMYFHDGRGVYATDAPLGGQGVYSDAKVQCQKIIDASSIKSSTVVPCIIGGSGREGLFIDFYNSISRFGSVFIPGPGIYKTSMVHVSDVASLISILVEKKPLGKFNAAAIDPLTINDWANIVGNCLNKNVKVFNLPLAPIRIISKILAYRVLAKEQLTMLGEMHVLDVTRSLNIGWIPKFNNKTLLVDLIEGIVKK
jgi:nucleoside-diphosphate-sugar epimerase